MNTAARLTAIVILVSLVLSGTVIAQGAPPPPLPQGFHLVVLLADNKPGDAAEGLPGGVSKALNDVRELLPFKSYRMLDTLLLRGNRVTARVAGVAGREYTVVINSYPTSPMSVSFQLTDYAAREAAPAVIETRFEMALGETVVVGTSKVKGTDQALVFLLTALTGAEPKSQR